MSINNMFYKELDKSCNLKTTKLLYCALIGACAVIRSNTVCKIFQEIMKTACTLCIWSSCSKSSTEFMFIVDQNERL